MLAYLGLGSNLGDRRAEIRRAVRALAQHGQVEAVSRLYETLPEGGVPEPLYLNAAVRIRTVLSPRELVAACLAIERSQGRVRPTSGEKAPRTIDIDLLLCDSQILDDPDLQVPHPRLLVRPFVRIPLAEVALPGLRHPASGEALDACEPHASVAAAPG
jgi:2-amino-4-hydroxy-6-hydroxymethyldihydropteridine diphosphokinase